MSVRIRVTVCPERMVTVSDCRMLKSGLTSVTRCRPGGKDTFIWGVLPMRLPSTWT